MAAVISPRNGRDMDPAEDSGSGSFDFRVSCNISVEDSSPASEIFSNGMLLPLSSSIPNIVAAPANIALKQRHQNLDPKPNINSLEDALISQKSSASDKSSSSSSFWNVGRSRSVGPGRGVSRSMLSSLFPFPRSTSMGSHLAQNRNQDHWERLSSGTRNLRRRGTNRNGYRRSGSHKSGGNGSGVRINPVINVNAGFVPRGGGGASKIDAAGSYGFFAYLLCTCGDKSPKDLEAS